MFGYVTIDKPELKIKDYTRYKAYYCGLCRVLLESYGFIGQMTLSYDMTFAVILLTSLYECETRLVTHRCKSHPVKKCPMLINEMTEYAAKMNIVLSYYHLVDDWNDEKSPLGLTGSKVLQKKARKIENEYPRQAEKIRTSLKRLSELESQGCTNIDLVAGCFGELMADMLVYKEDIWEEDLRRLGFFLGKFIYIMDAWDDLDKDIKKNSYNPLKELHASLSVQAYNQTCRDMLTMMMAETSSAFEQLPCLVDADILRNILYAGVWSKYEKILKERTETGHKKTCHQFDGLLDEHLETKENDYGK